jgi:hypothetical protein
MMLRILLLGQFFDSHFDSWLSVGKLLACKNTRWQVFGLDFDALDHSFHRRVTIAYVAPYKVDVC